MVTARGTCLPGFTLARVFASVFLFTAITVSTGCRSTLPPPTATRTPTIALTGLPTSTITPELPTATLVLQYPPTPTFTPVPTPTATRPPASPIPTVAPIARALAASLARETAVAKAAPVLTAVASQTPSPLNTFDYFDFIWMRSDIDLDHAAVFKIFALFGVGSPTIPENYISRIPPRGDGTMLFLEATQYWNALSPATQKTVNDFITPRDFCPPVPGASCVPPTPTSTPLPGPPFRFGAYVSTITDNDNVRGDLPLAGTWELDLTAKSRGSVIRNGRLVITRTWRLNGDRISFVDQYGSYACDEVGEEGTYRWSMDGNLLVFTALSDPCAGRVGLLTTHPWRMN